MKLRRSSQLPAIAAARPWAWTLWLSVWLSLPLCAERCTNPMSRQEALPSRRLGVVVGIGAGDSTTATQWATHRAAAYGISLMLVTNGAAASHMIRTGWDSMPFVKTVAVDAPLEQTLIELSEQAETVALGINGPDAHRTLGALVRRGHSNVAVIPDAAVDERQPVVVLIDGDPSSEPAIRRAIDEASRRHVSLVAVHTWSEPGHLEFPNVSWPPIEWANNRERKREVLAERLAGFQELYPDVLVRRITVSDRTFGALASYARTAQLVVVGMRSNSGLGQTGQGSDFRRLAMVGVPVLVAKT